MKKADTVLVTVTGRDKPGVTFALMSILSQHDAVLLDVQQVVIRGRLILTALIERLPQCGELVTDIENGMAALGMDADIEIGSDPVGSGYTATHTVLILGRPITAEAFSRIAGTLADLGANIASIKGVADYPVTGIALQIVARNASGERISGIRTALASLATELGVDISLSLIHI